MVLAANHTCYILLVIQVEFDLVDQCGAEEVFLIDDLSSTLSVRVISE